MRPTADPTRHRRRLRGYSALASAATLTATVAVLATASPPAQAARSTHRPDATTPNAISPDTALAGVSADSATDAWAIGYYENSSAVDVPLILHWTGTVWKKVKNPVPSTVQSPTLTAVSADSPTDAWAVGNSVNSSNAAVPLILHWTGTAWKTVASPVPSGAQVTHLDAVSADSATDAWAAGYYENSSGVYEPLILHWNGTAWSQVASPAPSGAQIAELDAVSADSPGDAWAAGYFKTSSPGLEPLVLHWNGTAWSQAASPVPSGAVDTDLRGVSAVSATDAWSAGYYHGSSPGYEPLILHWTGKIWKQAASPAPSGAQSTFLEAVSADSATDAWATGYDENSSGVSVPLILHWKDKAWKQAASPAPSGAESSNLDGVSADSATDAWAVGSYVNSSGTRESLTLHWTGTAWKKVTSPNGS